MELWNYDQPNEKHEKLRNRQEIIQLYYRERITSNPEIMFGKPIIKGTRITVELILRKMSEGMSIEILLEAYPNLIKEDVYAVLSYSEWTLKTQWTQQTL